MKILEGKGASVTDLLSTLIASIAPKTPTTPSYFPEYGIASV
jgi:hypothetical protein